MSSFTLNDVKIALKKGATWGTAADCSSGGMLLRASKLTIGGGWGEFLSRDNGWSKKLNDTVNLAFNGTVSITCDLTYNQGLSALVAGVLGTEGTATEVTGGQGDYRHVLTPASSIYGTFWTMAWLIEDDRSVELQSVKINKLRQSAAINDVGTITFDGVFDKFVITGATNTPAKINGLSGQSYQSAVFNGANAYFRLSSYSATAAQELRSVHNRSISSYEFTYERPIAPRFAMRGANTCYVTEPRDDGIIQGTLTAKFDKLDDADVDLLSLWNNGTKQMAELYYEGDQIGSGSKRCHNIKFPYLKAQPNQIPPGHDMPNSTGLMEPSITFRMLSASSLATGMGFADYLAISYIDHRTTAWTA